LVRSKHPLVGIKISPLIVRRRKPKPRRNSKEEKLKSMENFITQEDGLMRNIKGS